MTTARTIVEAAWRRVTVSSSIDTPSADEAADILEYLNDYLGSLRQKGCAYTHNTLALGDTVLLPTDLDGAMKAVLTRKISDNFQMPVTPALAQDADSGHREILNMMMTPFDLKVEEGLPGRVGEPGYDIDVS